MWTMLAGVPGKLKTLLDRLTAGRAEKLDNLNATITSRAPASTALLNTVWTDPRAEKLDQAGLIASVKSVQTGYVRTTSVIAGAASTEDQIYVNVSISAVDVNKTVCLPFSGGSGRHGTVPSAAILEGLSAAAASKYTCSLRLTSSTNLRISSEQVGAAYQGIAGRWTIVEFY